MSLRKITSASVLVLTLILGFIAIKITKENYLIFLCCLMTSDFITGVVNGITEKNLNSEIFYNGIVKKFYMLMMVVIIMICDFYMNTTLTKWIESFFIANESLSIIENVGKVVPLPDNIKNVFIQIRENKGGAKNENK